MEFKFKNEDWECKDTNCIHNEKGQCTRLSDDGCYGICWMNPSEGEY
ncbi:hypothetical protein [Clostridium botulinum]|nr:hypothetical protein [Clostridium botulinum]MBY6928989.1 hypothetical protein [Clostridium botulinum]